MSESELQTAADPKRIRTARRRLLRWYDAHQRDLPWRETRDPYAIWISEVMLQQTRVDTVRERWTAFLKRFPSIGHLARARLQSVLKMWEGLGYYARARNLHKAARILVRSGEPRLPETLEGLRALPGFGPYTSRAVASIAFGIPAAVVDGNVTRVLTRWSADGGDITRAATRSRVAVCADALLAPRRAGDFNQAVMELGALVCKPRAADCSACPLATTCVAHLEQEPLQFPVRPPRKRTPHYDVAAGLVWRGAKLLIARRPEDGLLGGLWEFPGGKVGRGETPAQACVRELKEETGLHVQVVRPFLSLDHAYTHFRITLHLFHCTVAGGRLRAPASAAAKFVPWEGLARYPFPRANRRALDELAGPPNLAPGGQ